jgi:hypothetical protein
MARRILELTLHIMNALSNKLGTFTMWTVDGSFARDIMNMHREMTSHLYDAESKQQIRLLLPWTHRGSCLATFMMSIVNICQPIDKKKRYNQPIARTRHI